MRNRDQDNVVTLMVAIVVAVAIIALIKALGPMP